MPIHPFFGRRLALIREERNRQGRKFFYVRHPIAGFLRIPAEWTDRFKTNRNGKLKIDPACLRALARACAVAKQQIDQNSLPLNTLAQRHEQATKCNRVPLGKTVSDSKGTVLRSVGDLDSQNRSTIQGE